MNISTRKAVRSEGQLNLLKKQFKETRDELKSVNELSIQVQLDKHKLVDNEKLVISEILKAAKCKSERGRRYSEDWFLLFIVFHIPSPKAYRLIRETEVLLLSTVSTIRR